MRPLGKKPRRPAARELVGPDTFQPPFPGEPVDQYRKRISKTCRSCEWFHPYDQTSAAGFERGECRRNPVYIEREHGDWCGEFKR